MRSQYASEKYSDPFLPHCVVPLVSMAHTVRTSPFLATLILLKLTPAPARILRSHLVFTLYGSLEVVPVEVTGVKNNSLSAFLRYHYFSRTSTSSTPYVNIVFSSTYTQ